MKYTVKEPVRVFKRKDKSLFAMMLLSAVSCLVASLVLSVDAIKLAANPAASLSCNFSEVINCGTVALSDQAQIFGFPNAFLGLMCEPIVIMIAIAGLSGVKFPKWMMFTAQCVYFVGLVFAFWLFYQSAFVIGAFCPWCLLVTVGTTLTFFTLLRYNIIYENLYFNKKFAHISKVSARMRVDSGIAVLILMILSFIMLYNYGSDFIS